MSYERLIKEHDEIERVARTMCDVVERDVSAVGEAVALRSQLSLLVSDHLRFEDPQVYGPLIARQDRGSAEIPLDLTADLTALRAAWGGYLDGWDDEAICADWPAFGTQTKEILAWLRERVQLETRLIYPVALQQGAIRLRDPGAGAH